MSEIGAYKQGYKEGYADAVKIFKEATTDFMAKLADTLPNDVQQFLEVQK